MIKLSCAMAIFVLSATSSLAAPILVGDWVNHRNGGVFVSEDKQCVARIILERRYKIYPSKRDDREFDGVYASGVIWSWLARRQRDCAIAKADPKDLYFQMRAWGTDLSPSTIVGIYDAKATFMQCSGDFCADAGLSRDSFSTRLDVTKDGYLVDLGIDIKAGSIIFQPFTERQKEVNAQARAFLTLLERLNKSEVPTFVDDRVELSALARQRRDMILILERYWDLRMSQHGSFEIVKAFDLEPAQDASPRAEVLHFQVSHRLTDGTQFGEVFELLRVGDKWKLLTLE